MSILAASRDLKNKIQEVCPNNANLPVEQWLKLAALQIRIDYTRLYRLWRDNRAKPEPYEAQLIADALDEAKLLREIKQLQLKQKYLQHIISGEIYEIEKETALKNIASTDFISGSFA